MPLGRAPTWMASSYEALEKWGSPSSSLSYELKPKFKEFLVGRVVALVTYCAAKLTETCSPMIIQKQSMTILQCL